MVSTNGSVVPLAMFGHSATRGNTCINKKFSHQVVKLALIRNLATRWRHMH